MTPLLWSALALFDPPPGAGVAAGDGEEPGAQVGEGTHVGEEVGEPATTCSVCQCSCCSEQNVHLNADAVMFIY